MKIFYNKFLIVSTILLIIGGVYLHYSNDLNTNGIVPVAFGSSLVSSNVLPVEPSLSENDQISSDISFLSAIVSLKRIKIDTTLFSSKSFNRLKDNSVKIEKVTAGRSNPFAPISTGGTSSGVSSSTSKVVTDPPTQITDSTVVFNGTVNVTTGVTDTYFEYGPTQELGTVTEKVKISLVGTFIKNILGLTSGTNYFYKACAKINNVASCGEVVSFTTN